MTQQRKPLFLKKQWLGFAVLFAMLAVLRLTIYMLPDADRMEDAAIPDSITGSLGVVRHYSRDTVVLRLRPFDPNTADSVTLRQLGLRPWQVRNLLKYRAKNGRFRKKEDFRKLYGLTDSAYAALEPFISIVPLPRDSFMWDTLAADTMRRMFISRKRDTILELNSADTAALQMIRGIGPYTALRIVQYRRQLGGYVSSEQLREIDRLPHADWDSIVPHFYVCTDSVRLLPLNRASVEKLNAHPYISFTQAKTLYTLRRRRISIKNMDELQSLLSSDSSFSASTLSRLEPYLDFSQ